MDYCSKNKCGIFASILTIVIFMASLLSALGGQIFLSLNTELGPYQFTVHNSSLIINAQRLGRSPNFEQYRGFTICDDDRFFGCLINGEDNEVFVHIDERPSSPLPDFVIQKRFILVSKNSEEEKILMAIQDPGTEIFGNN